MSALDELAQVVDAVLEVAGERLDAQHLVDALARGGGVRGELRGVDGPDRLAQVGQRLRHEDHLPRHGGQAGADAVHVVRVDLDLVEQPLDLLERVGEDEGAVEEHLDELQPRLDAREEADEVVHLLFARPDEHQPVLPQEQQQLGRHVVDLQHHAKDLPKLQLEVAAVAVLDGRLPRHDLLGEDDEVLVAVGRVAEVEHVHDLPLVPGQEVHDHAVGVELDIGEHAAQQVDGHVLRRPVHDGIDVCAREDHAAGVEVQREGLHLQDARALGEVDHRLDVDELGQLVVEHRDARHLVHLELRRGAVAVQPRAVHAPLAAVHGAQRLVELHDRVGPGGDPLDEADRDGVELDSLVHLRILDV
mmetsp:Transcript_27290/g.71962  ORF Transcript_27290/g.71962 Transcript_27290/m.71962 type:complete len:361 (-) Transcript_27290:711-1793(-)